MPYKNAKDRTNAVVRWRQNAKRKLIAGFGGRCAICGYDRCDGALEFHHIDPGGKDFGLGRFSVKAWAKLVAEVAKCVLLCAVCHREVHAGIAVVPANAPRFDSNKAQTGSSVARAAVS